MRSLVPLLLLAACVGDPEGLRRTPAGDGPLVRVDFDAEPLPDIPFPNDLATTPDPASPTGQRLNLPLTADLRIEKHSREGLNKMSGFGLYAPIQVGFDQPLDVQELLDRHPDDLHVDGHELDDAILLIDVDPDSPTFGELQPLDFGNGRFPQQLTDGDSLLTSDPHPGPSLLFDTVNEDRDGDGVLDNGEDTDGDGVLDVANVWPPGGDPYFDLLTAYDLNAQTLYLRPIVPLRETTTYAVVLTERLVGEDGSPVRSPWEWVNHTRQTPALEPLRELLPRYELSVDDVAFAWSFTTGDPSTDLHDVVSGLFDGEGPYAHLAQAYPAQVTEAHVLHTLDEGSPTLLAAEDIILPLTNLGLIPIDTDFVGGAYTTFTRGIVGGAFESPYLLVDKDGDGADSDESWALDRDARTVVAASNRVTFSCAIPKETEEHQAPFPVSIHGHGLGSTRIEFLAWAWALNRQGIASCGIDAVGHGLFLGDSYDDLIAALLAANNAEPLWWHLRDGRFRDLDNDGVPNASADQFSADLLHTRDMIRQPVVDWVQLIRVLQSCGQGQMDELEITADGPEATGRSMTTCDWDDDGELDLGGPGTRFFFDGVSMGGVQGALAAAALPDLDAAVLTVPGGGLFDIGTRTSIGSVQDALTGKALTPLFALRSTGIGTWELRQQVVSFDRDPSYVIAVLDELPVGGRMVVHNLTLGERASVRIPADRETRVPMEANAPEPAEKALLAGIPEGGVEEGEVYSVPDNEGMGDRMKVEIIAASGELVRTVDTFELPVTHEGVTHEEGSPLIALSWGLGLTRGSRELRQVVGVLAAGAEAADPVIYARQWADEPVREEAREVLIALTVGDTLVPIAAGAALARAAGLVDFTNLDDRYGTSVDRYLIDSETIQADIRRGSYSDPVFGPVHHDPDDLDNGIDPYGEPTLAAPVRASRLAGDGVHALRFLYVSPTGSHAYLLPDPSLPFDVNTFGAQQMATFLATGEISDEPCLATADCPFLVPIEPLP